MLYDHTSGIVVKLAHHANLNTPLVIVLLVGRDGVNPKWMVYAILAVDRAIPTNDEKVCQVRGDQFHLVVDNDWWEILLVAQVYDKAQYKIWPSRDSVQGALHGSPCPVDTGSLCIWIRRSAEDGSWRGVCSNNSYIPGWESAAILEGLTMRIAVD